MKKKRRRILGRPGACYHVISRFVDRQFAMGEEVWKRHFFELMIRQAKFAGVEILTYCLMGNHFHILLRVPPAPELLEKEVLRRLALIWSEKRMKEYQQLLDRLREQSAIADKLIETELDRHRRRMYSLPEFVKDLKQRFSRHYNKAHARKGTLFEERYKSVLVQDGKALRMMAAYIDLNPVRAGIVQDPADYFWCGYAAAVGGNQNRRQGLRAILADPNDQVPNPSRPTWKELSKRYRFMLFERGRATRHPDGRQKKRGFSRKQAIENWRTEGEIPLTTFLRCKARYFTETLVFGDKEFIEEHIEANRDRLGVHPKANDASNGMFSIKPLRGAKLE